MYLEKGEKSSLVGLVVYSCKLMVYDWVTATKIV